MLIKGDPQTAFLEAGSIPALILRTKPIATHPRDDVMQ